MKTDFIRVLWLYQYKSDYDFDNWLHMKFAETLAQDSQFELFAYGPGLEECNPQLTPIHYRPDLTIEDLYRELKFDVVILNTKSRMFFYYNPHNDDARDCWVPKGFDRFNNAPKIVIEEDYHYEKNDLWYQELRINLILQRHYASSLRQEIVPMKWFPFSVDPSIFKPSFSERINRICIAGSVNGAYPERVLASEILKKHDLIDIFSSKQMIGQKYVECLQQYVCHLSGSSRYHITPAKMFEIMASGSVLLTNEEKDLPLIFDDGSYVTYRTDLSNTENSLLEKARRILTDFNYRESVVRKAHDCIKRRHTHSTRIRELKQIIENLQYGMNLTKIHKNDIIPQTHKS